MFTQYEAQAPLKVERYSVMLYERKKRVLWGYAGKLAVNTRLEEDKIAVIGEIFCRESVPKKQPFLGWNCPSGAYSLLMEYEGNRRWFTLVCVAWRVPVVKVRGGETQEFNSEHMPWK